MGKNYYASRLLIEFNVNLWPPSGLRECVNGLFYLRECVKIEKKLRECVNLKSLRERENPFFHCVNVCIPQMFCVNA